MIDRRYDLLEEYLKDLQADRPSAVFSRLGDDKELAIVLRTAKTVRLLTRRPDAGADFASTLERRILVASEDKVQAERRVLRWGYIIPGLATLGVSVIAVWYGITPKTAEVAQEAAPITTAVRSKAALADYAFTTSDTNQDLWEDIILAEEQLDQDFAALEIVLSSTEGLYDGFDYSDAQAALSSINY